MQYLFYRYCMGVRQVQRRDFLVSHRDFLVHHQHRCRSGELVTPYVDTPGTSSYRQEVPDVLPGEQMSNERLRSALLARGMTVQGLAEEIDVNPKTVERWITQGKVPYRRHQYATASVLKMDVTTLWDDTRAVDSAADLSKAEIVTVYPHRHLVPSGLWREIYERAERYLDVLVYSGLWLSEDPQFLDLLKKKVELGGHMGQTQVRILLGDPKLRGSEAARHR